jgi:hypothetical protein
MQDSPQAGSGLTPRDLVVGPGVPAIAAYTPDPPRRIRHLINTAGFPAFSIGGRLYAYKSDIDAYYRAAAEKQIANGWADPCGEVGQYKPPKTRRSGLETPPRGRPKRKRAG